VFDEFVTLGNLSTTSPLVKIKTNQKEKDKIKKDDDSKFDTFISQEDNDDNLIPVIVKTSNKESVIDKITDNDDLSNTSKLKRKNYFLEWLKGLKELNIPPNSLRYIQARKSSNTEESNNS